MDQEIQQLSVGRFSMEEDNSDRFSMDEDNYHNTLSENHTASCRKKRLTDSLALQLSNRHQVPQQLTPTSSQVSTQLQQPRFSHHQESTPTTSRCTNQRQVVVNNLNSERYQLRVLSIFD
jgi:hypothetical protein